MKMISKNILGVVGKTPLIEIGGVLAKLETTNPTGSVKDRMAAYLVEKAEEREELKPGDRIIEVTSGNTGIAFAMIAAIKGYRFTAVMPESMSIERRQMMQAFGADVVLTPAKEDIIGAMKKYNELVKKYPSAWLPRQFENNDNIEAHREGIGKEIVEQAGNIDAFVAGTGTGGTLIGVAKALKAANPDVKIIGVEPMESAVISGGNAGLHGIQGIGEGFIPKIVEENSDLIEEIITIKTDDAIEMQKKLAKEHGVLVGISSGANVLAAMKAKEKYKKVVTILPDRGERYLS
ncbi:MAG: cysteine synthase A [bacterium]|nr:cysteine synthase A [bacterium]